jgi:AraC family transcriptional regulator
MTVRARSSFTQWYCEGRQASYLRSSKSSGGVLDLVEVARPAGDMSRPGVPEIVLYQDLLGGSRVSGDMGGGRFDMTSEKGSVALAAPNFATTAIMESSHQLRCLSFPMAQWQEVLDEAADGRFSLESPQLYRGPFHSPVIQSALRNLWKACRRVCWRGPQVWRFWLSCAGWAGHRSRRHSGRVSGGQPPGTAALCGRES